MWAIIGGTGFEKFEGFKTIEELDRDTPFGKTSKGFKRVQLGGEEILFIPRHGTDHDQLPSEVNYRANIWALKKMGASKLLSFSAVGSLVNECAPGDLVVPHQFIDKTKSLRKTSYCGDGIVGHVPLAEPTSKVLISALQGIATGFSFSTHFDKTLVVIEGPYFSSKAESHLYRSWKADIIGMTAFPEYALAREAGLAYLPCFFVTDYDCWKDDIPHVTVDEVMRVMRENNKKAFEVAQQVTSLKSAEVMGANESESGLKNALMTPIEAMTKEQQAWIEILLRS